MHLPLQFTDETLILTHFYFIVFSLISHSRKKFLPLTLKFQPKNKNLDLIILFSYTLKIINKYSITLNHLTNFSVKVVVNVIIAAAPTTNVTHADKIILILSNIKTQDSVDREDDRQYSIPTARNKILWKKNAETRECRKILSTQRRKKPFLVQ